MATDTSDIISRFEEQLDSFDALRRQDALLALLQMAKEGQFAFPAPKQEVNVHFHSFFSFNGLGWSPSRIAWEAKKYGLEVAGKVEFDVLDGMEEFLHAGEILGLKTVNSLETRVFIGEYASQVINSPGEPGVAYFMTAGCCRPPDKGSQAEVTARVLYETARSRTEELTQRVNLHLAPVVVDYEADVLPLTPAGNATERHLLAACDNKARELFDDEASLAEFWSSKLGTDAASLVNDSVKLQETMRSKLMKQGGAAYVTPDTSSFPPVETVISFAKEIGAIPCAAWLDGTNPGEDDMDQMLELLLSKGVSMANITPDRNWNIKDAAEKELKLRKLEEMVRACRKHGLPIIIGTEMNKLGLPFVDNFQTPELQPYIQDFMDGAHFLWGHTLLSRHANSGYFSAGVEDAYGKARQRKNKFFTLVGRLPIPPQSKLEQLRKLDLDPERLYAFLRD
ncbi:MAG: hypothetical protein WCL39_03645 [Armatimonadota bacterium]